MEPAKVDENGKDSVRFDRSIRLTDLKSLNNSQAAYGSGVRPTLLRGETKRLPFSGFLQSSN
jgi:hypothetical protein